jgi:hypothetical protein
MNFVTSCCNAEIIVRHGMEHPDGTGHGIPFKYDACNSCGLEVDEPVATCECCGEPAESFITTRLGEWCTNCTTEHAEDLIEREVTV